MTTGSSDELREGKEPPPPGVKWMAAVRWLLLVAVGALALWSGWEMLAGPGGKGLKYTCPMVEHAFVVTDEPGDCPLCHMTLMELEPALIEARRQEAQQEMAGVGLTVPGLVPVAVHLDRAQKMGVRSAMVEEMELDEELRAPAYVASPEQGESRVHARSPGYLERVLVTEIGVQVHAGQTLAYLYAPEIYRAQEEFLLARRWQGEADAGAASREGAHAGGSLAEAARRRLELLGLSSRDLDEIVQKNAPVRAVPVRAPASGVVTRKEAALGAYVTPEMPLYEIVDFSRVYLVADVLAIESLRLRVGDRGIASFGPDELPVVVDLIYPEVNDTARTLRVRLRFLGKTPVLRPGLYGAVRFALGKRRALVIPRDAVLDTGTQRHVFVDLGAGRFAPRLVAVGAEHQGRVEIHSGLKAGERVVSGAAFLIDAESRLQAAFSGVLVPSAEAGVAPSASEVQP
ncbi:MAG: efflux RND transporter periplasmic adaptor subunit [Myxococcales bacterium]|nr:efflux RND transporter periplasmic adaptor subunit [Polyangiaceae bacterium]MDW8248663.1 efflux RND transporter periplasmic adaptor subunit [Myxococcales bacterium]